MFLLLIVSYVWLFEQCNEKAFPVVLGYFSVVISQTPQKALRVVLKHVVGCFHALINNIVKQSRAESLWWNLRLTLIMLKMMVLTNRASSYSRKLIRDDVISDRSLSLSDATC